MLIIAKKLIKLDKSPEVSNPSLSLHLNKSLVNNNNYCAKFVLNRTLYNVNFFTSKDEFENRDGNKVNLFDPDGVLYFPFLFTYLGVAALLLLTGGAWDLCRKINHRMKKKGSTLFNKCRMSKQASYKS